MLIILDQFTYIPQWRGQDLKKHTTEESIFNLKNNVHASVIKVNMKTC